MLIVVNFCKNELTNIINNDNSLSVIEKVDKDEKKVKKLTWFSSVNNI